MEKLKLLAAAAFIAVTGFVAPALQACAADRQMITAANPHAAEAGLEILRAGGSAVDAAISAQMVLGLV